MSAEFLQHVMNGISLGSLYALIALGYNQREVREIVGKLDGTKSAGEQIKHALQLLSR
jgi:Holliday junction resolvasome RuvABC DNA-binding subunit